jgi:hypothetical protein
MSQSGLEAEFIETPPLPSPVDQCRTEEREPRTQLPGSVSPTHAARLSASGNRDSRTVSTAAIPDQATSHGQSAALRSEPKPSMAEGCQNVVIKGARWPDTEFWGRVFSAQLESAEPLVNELGIVVQFLVFMCVVHWLLLLVIWLIGDGNGPFFQTTHSNVMKAAFIMLSGSFLVRFLFILIKPQNISILASTAGEGWRWACSIRKEHAAEETAVSGGACRERGPK